MSDPEREAQNDYLWDRSGPPDPVVAALEQRLAPLAHGAHGPRLVLTRPRGPWRGAFLVAALALLTAAPFVFLRGGAAPSRGFELALRAGAARVLPPSAKEASLLADRFDHYPVGSVLECEPGARVTLRVGEALDGLDLGEVEVEGPSVVRLDESSEVLKKLFLQRGTVRARISALAKQRLFQVGTPVGNAVDLGCVYTMNVKDDHTTLLRVQLGRVAFELDKQSLYVWAGARCTVDRARGAGLPVDEGAEVAFADAADRWSRALDAAARREALVAMRASARFSDAATLWHVVVRSPAAERPFAVEVLEAFSPAPASVARDAAVKGDAGALEAWRTDVMGW